MRILSLIPADGWWVVYPAGPDGWAERAAPLAAWALVEVYEDGQLGGTAVIGVDPAQEPEQYPSVPPGICRDALRYTFGPPELREPAEAEDDPDGSITDHDYVPDPEDPGPDGDCHHGAQTREWCGYPRRTHAR